VRKIYSAYSIDNVMLYFGSFNIGDLAFFTCWTVRLHACTCCHQMSCRIHAVYFSLPSER